MKYQAPLPTAVVVGELAPQTAQPVVLVTQIVEKREYSLPVGLILIAGIIFWAHGKDSHDAWFKGEQVTGEAITGFYIGLIGLICCCACCGGLAAGLSKDSEIETLPIEEGKADSFLKNNVRRRPLQDLFASDPASTETVIDVDTNAFQV